MSRLGLAGRAAAHFQSSELTPLLALAGLLLGLLAVLITPREEEPQIDVTFAHVFVPFPGADPATVERLITTPAEQVLSEIDGVKHIYSVSQPGMAVLTVEYRVKVPRTEAIVRLYNAVLSNQNWLPEGLGAGPPLIQPKGIDDVPVVTLTLWSADPAHSAYSLGEIAHALESEIKRVPGTRDVYTIGAAPQLLSVRLDPARLAAYGLALDDLRRALQAGNTVTDRAALVTDGRSVQVQAGSFYATPEEVAGLIVGVHDDRPVYLRDVAQVGLGPDDPAHYVLFGSGPAAAQKGIAAQGQHPAVTLAVAKQPGENAVDVARAVIQRVGDLRGIYIPDDVEVTLTRDYGATANDKATTLIKKLIFATLSVVVLVGLALGRREAAIVGAAVVVTLALTLFASWAFGFTLNRVSLFALIFSIGILVDDAIVVVENIHRHMALAPGDRLVDLIPRAVDEVGGPTILATFTVIAALLPMAFVSGLMGPYMSPIPINASIGMLLSLAVAFVFTPWLARALLRPAHGHAGHQAGRQAGRQGDRLLTLAGRVIAPFLDPRHGTRRRAWLGVGVLALIGVSVGLVVVQWVVLKMLPFDNKSEFAVVLDLPEGTPVETTARVLSDLAAEIARVPEVTDYQIYAGTAAPIGFNGLVRQYDLRRAPHLGDIQVNLTDKHARERKSHQIARALRPALAQIAARHDAALKLVEVPPGPPVQAPLVIEVYGPDAAGRLHLASALRDTLAATPDIVDVDDSVQAAAPKLHIAVDRSRAALLGLGQDQVAQAVDTLLRGADVTYWYGAEHKYATPIRMAAAAQWKGDLDTLLTTRLRGAQGSLVPLIDAVQVEQTVVPASIHHKDLLPVAYVTADMAGELDSPLYGMAELYARIAASPLLGAVSPQQHLIAQPQQPYRYAIKWDGEWQVTYETFRDMGIAYGVGLILIYLLVVAQFRSYRVPLVIMAPIPLTVIGVMPGHALMGAQFTATSMIGMIALAGIIVRNSILLVDFVNSEHAAGVPLAQAVIRSAAVRAKPIALTGLAAMLGAFFILDDPIFNGLAVSLIFGILISTILTLVVIPVLYYALQRRAMA